MVFRVTPRDYGKHSLLKIPFVTDKCIFTTKINLKPRKNDDFQQEIWDKKLHDKNHLIIKFNLIGLC